MMRGPRLWKDWQRPFDRLRDGGTMRCPECLCSSVSTTPDRHAPDCWVQIESDAEDGRDRAWLEENPDGYLVREASPAEEIQNAMMFGWVPGAGAHYVHRWREETRGGHLSEMVTVEGYLPTVWARLRFRGGTPWRGGMPDPRPCLTLEQAARHAHRLWAERQAYREFHAGGLPGPV